MATQITSKYAQYVLTFMTIDNEGDVSDGKLIVTVPSESDDIEYTVRCTEHHDHVEVTSCTCKGFRYYGYCKHQTIVRNFYVKLYAVNIKQAQEKQVQQAILEAETLLSTGEVAIVEQSITTESVRHFESKTSAPQIVAPKIIKLDSQSRRTASFFGNLPSRRVA